MVLAALDRRLRAIALALAALAGAVDAMGFLMAGGYFVSFMSGNSTRLAVDAVSGHAVAALAAGLIGGFVLGVMLGELLGRAGDARRRTARVLGLMAALLTGAAALAGIAPPFASWLAVAALVLAMGAANMALPQTGPVRIGLTYMTGTLVRIGKGLADRLSGQAVPGLAADLALWGCLAAGAVIGAGAFQLFGPVALWGPALVALALALAAPAASA